MTRLLRSWLPSFLLLLGTVPAADARDNFLFLLADDLGVDGVGIYSSDLLYGHPGEGASPGPTPNIDALAAEGILFRNAWASPSCSPARAATLTGRHGFRTGVGRVGGVLDPGETILPELLASSHLNAALGKWHVGGFGVVDHPIDAGFDYYAGFLGGTLWRNYTSWQKTTNSSTTTGSTQEGFSTYATTDTVDEALAKIAEFGASPWLIWVAFNAPHLPYHVPPSGLTTIAVDASSSDTIKYQAAIEAMDTEIGRLLAGMPADVFADTTIVFFGDNGTPGAVVQPPFDPNGAKGTVYEGGINVPLIVKSPWIDAADRGKESLALVSTTDLFATVAEIAGVASSAEDSVSIVPYLQSPDTATLRSCVYSEMFEPNGFGPYTDERRAARDDVYKLIWRNGVYEEFFDLVDDPDEQLNLLPVSGLGSEERAAYDALVSEIENGRCGAPAVPSVPGLGGPALAALVLLLLAVSRARPTSTGHPPPLRKNRRMSAPHL